MSAAQRRLAALLANPADERTTSEKIKAAKCRDAKFDAWVRQTEFVAYVRRLVEQYTDIEQARVWGTLLRNAQNGDTKAAQLFLELKQKERASSAGQASQEPIVLCWDESEAGATDSEAMAGTPADEEGSASCGTSGAEAARGDRAPASPAPDEPSAAAADDAAPAP